MPVLPPGAGGGRRMLSMKYSPFIMRMAVRSMTVAALLAALGITAAARGAVVCGEDGADALHTHSPAGAGDTISLVEEIDGLPLEARTAYLQYLSRQGRSDAVLFFQLALAFHEGGNADSALFYYKRTIEADPEHFKALVNMGVLYDDMGEPLLAENSFRSAISVNPDDVLANSHLAFMIFLQQRYGQAWHFLSRALELAPDHPQPRFYLAIFFWEARMYREALAEWERVVELDPGSYLAQKANENIVLLQKALNSPSPSSTWKPSR